MGPNALINGMTYQAGQQNEKWPSDAAECWATMESPEPTGWGVTEGLGDLRFPLWARPVSSEGWVGWWGVLLTDMVEGKCWPHTPAVQYNALNIALDSPLPPPTQHTHKDTHNLQAQECHQEEICPNFPTATNTHAEQPRIAEAQLCD